ncbi:DUF3613 domain-containing protein [Caballeronia sp. LjRoot31]|jgi:hypothetical protein|uniref:DUF3613 domain-containing protein n=1 Tax=Caballeronia sp. LjRoot31 TaxID=3342324 RepID=UPI003ECDBA5C
MNEYRTGRGRARAASQAAGLMVALGLMSIATHSMAQTQTRLTEQPREQLQQQASEAPAVQVAQSHTDAPVTQIGDAAHSLLALQRSGQLAAPAQPMLGVEASAAYARYLKSFDHPIPEHLDSSVGAVGGGASN